MREKPSSFVGSIENIYITVIDYQWSAICGKDNFDDIILFMNNIIFMIAFITVWHNCDFFLFKKKNHKLDE